MSINELLYELSYIDQESQELRKEYQCKTCPFCQIDDGEFIENEQTRASLFFRFKKCNHCSLVYPYPRPCKSVVEGYFQQALDHTGFPYIDLGPRPLIERIYEKLSPRRYSYSEFTKYARKGNMVLDVGAGNGAATKRMLDCGCKVDVVELNPARSAYLRNVLGVNTYEGSFETYEAPHAYDMVTFSQVLMHLFSLKDILWKANGVLKMGGLLVASVMNFDSIIQRTVRSPYPGKGLTPFTIVSYFTVESISKILGKAGFEVLHVYHRHDGLLHYLFGGQYPRRCGNIFHFMDLLIGTILAKKGISNYFAVVAKKVKIL